MSIQSVLRGATRGLPLPYLLLGLLLLPLPAAAQPVVTGVEVTDIQEIEVTFSVNIDPVTGADTSHYQIFVTDSPTTVIPVTGILVLSNRATLTLGAELQPVGYTLRTQGIESTTGGDPSPLSTTTFDGPGVEALPIATIQANPAAYNGQTVTVEGVVYIPSDYRQPASSIWSAYIQDESGRGINIFGYSDDPLIDDPMLQTVGNRVRLTGTVTLFNTTVEIADLSALSLVASGQSVTPQVVTTGAANSAAYEGTYIQVSGNVVSQSSSSSAINYTVNDGSGTIVVRVVTTIGAPTFANGTTITARGAGSFFSPTYQILVGVASDFFEGGGGPDLIPPTVTGASASTATQVVVSFSEALDATTAQTAGNYSVYQTSAPGNTVSISGAVLGGSNVTLTLGASLAEDVSYTVAVTAVEDVAGNPIAGSNTASFTYTASSAIPIATIQANPESYSGQVVTVQGQVYIPTDYRGTVISGYIQDASGRGINLFGDTADTPVLQDTGNIVQVTGTVELYFTTVEIVDLTEVTLLSSGNDPLSPAVLSTGAAANAQWEGTFIQVTGTISSQAVGGPGINYTVSDGSGNIIVRVVDTLGAASFSNGTTITARGAGGAYGSDFQVLVGAASDVFEGGGGEDTTPPTVIGASSSSPTQVLVGFSEALDAATAQDPFNYSVYQTAAPANTVGVASANLSGSNVTLTLSGSLAEGTGYTVAVVDVEDLAGNVIAGGNTATFSYVASSAIPIATIQANPESYSGQEVTVRGQVYIPSDYRGSTISGYIQDESNRGINLFGFAADDPRLQDTGNVVEVTGTVELYFTTVEIVDLSSITLISSGNDPLSPALLSTGAAANAQWEGTYIQVTGTISSQAVGGPGINYTVNDGSGAIIVRVVDTLSAPTFTNGTTITARGAGGAYGSDFQLLVGETAGVFEGGGGEDTTPPTVTAALGTTDTQLRVSFSEAVDPTTGAVAGNYSVYETATPTNAVSVLAASVSGANATLTLGSSLVDGRSYTVRVTGVEDLAGNVIAGSNTASFTYSAGGITPIADIHANIESYIDQEVTVRAQVYIPTNYRSTVTSGYVQDGSGRGLNVFGSGANVPALQNTGNIVEITGTVTLYFTTVEIENISRVVLVSSGNPPLIPRDLGSTAEANDDDWEGTYIRVRGNILSKSETGGAINYSINDGSGPIIARVYPDIGATDYPVGTEVWVAGAGNQYQTDFQIAVGVVSDFSDQEPADVSPPILVQAYRSDLQQLTLRFNEALDDGSLLPLSNYTLDGPAETTVEILSAQVGGSNREILLGLAEDINTDQLWEITVVGVADLEGNAIVVPQTLAVGPPPPTAARLDGPARTFLPREGEHYPITMVLPAWTADGSSAEILLRVFDLQGRLKKTLYDSRFEPSVGNDFEDDYRHTVEWDGRDEYGDRVLAGAYVVYLLVSESTNGKKHEVQMPVVVATRLER